MRDRIIYIFALVVLAMTWIPQPRQAAALARGEDEILYGGARYGGKTEALLAWMTDPNYINHPGFIGVILRKNATDLKEWIHRARLMYAPLGATITGNPPTVKWPAGGEIYLGHLKDQSSIDKFQGFNIQKLGIEELTQVKSEDHFEQICSSVRSGGTGLQAQVFCTANPGGPGHVWVRNRFVKLAFNKPYRTPEGITRIFIQSLAKDNPIGTVNDPGYVARLNSIKNENLRRAWVDGDWDVFIGQYFDTWNEEQHVIRKRDGRYFWPNGRQFVMDPAWNYYRGFDWGYAAPAAMVWLCVDFDGNHVIYREYYEKNKTCQQIAKRSIELTPKSERVVATVADPSIWAKNQQDAETSYSYADLLSQNGLHCIPGNNDRLNGWQRIRNMLYWDIGVKPKLYVVEDCSHFRETLPALEYDENKIEDLDTDGEDHLADAARYVLMHTAKATPPVVPKSYIDKIFEEMDGTDDAGADIDRYFGRKRA